MIQLPSVRVPEMPMIDVNQNWLDQETRPSTPSDVRPAVDLHNKNLVTRMK